MNFIFPILFFSYEFSRTQYEAFPIKFKTRYTTKKTSDKDMAITTAFSDNTLKRLFHYLPKNKMQLLVNQIYMETLLKL